LPRANVAQICHGPRVADPVASSSVSGRRTLIVMVAIVLVAAIPAVAIPMYVLRSSAPELPDDGALPAFHLVDERGQAFTEDALRGQATIVSFVFTRCDMICPVNAAKLERVQERVLLDSGVRLLSISTDPTYDTPERLAAYAARWHADPTKRRFVTGPRDDVLALVEGGFMAGMRPDGTTQKNGAASIAHAGYFVLVGPDLHMRGRYETDEVRLDELVKDARFLARTARSK
jgi:protein SCO1/2